MSFQLHWNQQLLLQHSFLGTFIPSFLVLHHHPISIGSRAVFVSLKNHCMKCSPLCVMIGFSSICFFIHHRFHFTAGEMKCYKMPLTNILQWLSKFQVSHSAFWMRFPAKNTLMMWIFGLTFTPSEAMMALKPRPMERFPQRALTHNTSLNGLQLHSKAKPLQSRSHTIETKLWAYLEKRFFWCCC